MKKTATTLAIIFIGILVLLFGKIPTYPMSGDLKSINITSISDNGMKKYSIIEKPEIAALQEACGLVWMDLIPVGSLEGHPNWHLELHFKDDDKLKKIYIDEDEFNGSRHSNEALIKFLREKYG